MIRVQTEDFDAGAELNALTAGKTDVGGVCLFVGRVRDMGLVNGEETDIQAMTLEHYPGMTEKQLQAIEAEALERWPLDDTLIIHRYGRLLPGDNIVLVAATSAHRDAAFDACRFLIDWLKTQAPFWKVEESENGAEWVEAKESDDKATEKWKKQ